MQRFILSLLALMTLPLAAFSQSDDTGFWLSAGVDKKITKKWTVGMEAELRTRDDFATMDRLSLGLSSSYKITKWLKASAGYTLLHDPNTERISYYEEGDKKVLQEVVSVGDPKKLGTYAGLRHRVTASLTGDVNIGKFNVSLRERWQYTYRPAHTVDRRWDYYNEEYEEEEHTYKSKSKSVLRSRLQVEYKIKPLKITPYVSGELFNAWNLTKTRYTAGVDWKPNKTNVVGLSYRYQVVNNDDDDFEPNMHIVALEYKYKF
ncbi:MAG: DUF2490 domain-containing protein [Prevotella sp.]|nr:DUF2490 domain-containing protein [Prevotella sp.]